MLDRSTSLTGRRGRDGLPSGPRGPAALNTARLMQRPIESLDLLLRGPSKPKAAVAAEIKTQIEPLYEQLFHMMNLEFASIKPELSQRLAQDIDFQQRKVVIDSVEAFLKDRETVLKGMMQ